MKLEIALRVALAAALAGCGAITVRNSDNLPDDAIEFTGERGEEAAHGSRIDCAGWTAITAYISLDGQPADSMIVTASCGGVEVADCVVLTGIGQKSGSCSHTESLNRKGLLGCAVTQVSGRPKFAASCTLR